MRIPRFFALALTLATAGAEAAAVKVGFSATTQSAKAPFAIGSVVSGEIIINLDAPRLPADSCAAGATCLDGAVGHGRFSVDALAFSADDLDLQLTPVSNGVLLSIRAVSSSSSGRFAGSVPSQGLDLVGAEFEARFSATYFPERLDALELDRDFTVLFGRLHFAPTGASSPLTTFTLDQSEFRSLVVSQVPLPAAVCLLLLPVASLAGVHRRGVRAPIG